MQNVITNSHSRPILNWFGLTKAEKSEHVHSAPFLKKAQFFRYHDKLYDLKKFKPIRDMPPWDFYFSKSDTIIIVIQFSDDATECIVGQINR